MREVRPGCPARSLAGHDKDQYFIILAVAGDCVMLADGKTKTVEKPKRKKIKHIQAASQPLFSEMPVTDEMIRSQLKNYARSHCGI